MQHPVWSKLLPALLALACAAPAQARTTSGSTTDADGNTISITKNADGTTTRTVTNADGQVTSNETLQPEPPTQVPPRQPGNSASTRNPDGTTTTITKNPDGTTTRTVTDANGNVVSSAQVEPEPPTTIPPRQAGTSVSMRSDGQVTTLSKNADGTTTRTVTNADGEIISTQLVQPEPPTQIAPRTGAPSASTVDADGNTISVELGPDGIRLRKVLSPDGRVLKAEPMTPPAGAQLLYDTVQSDDCTANVAMVLTQEGGRTLLETSVVATGKGSNYRTWVPESILLQAGTQKHKPVATAPNYVEQESVVARLAPALFAAIGSQYELDAEKAEASKGTPCPLTGKTEGGEGHERGKIGRAIDKMGMTAGLGVLAAQARGQIEGRRATFDVTNVIPELTKDGRILLRIANTERGGINTANQRREVNVKVPVKFNLLVMVTPTIIHDTGEEF